MRQIDYSYIASNISNLSRIAVRVYRNKERIIYEDPSNFPTDPASPYIDGMLTIGAPVSYYISPYEHFYGIVHYGDCTMIFGPTWQITPEREKIREFMFSLGIKENYMTLYQGLLNSITPLPLEMFLHELCLVYYFISEEKLELSQISLYDSGQSIEKQNASASLTAPAKGSRSIHTELNRAGDLNDYTEGHSTVDFEQKMLSLITAGDLPGLRELFKTMSSGRSGKVAPNYLRQIKNIFIASATLVSRAAMAGGLPSEEALTLSDKYIQHAESYNNPEQVMNLQYNMIIDYTTLVNELTNGKQYDRTTRKVQTYIKEHLTEDLSVADIAEALSTSRSYLSTKYKKDTGMTINAFIRHQRIEKAKDLLKTTDRSILDISTYLGFSSQGYFQNVFRRETGLTPAAYRGQ